MMFANHLSSALNFTSTAFWAGLLTMAFFEAAIIQLVRRSLPLKPARSADPVEAAYAAGRISFKIYMELKHPTWS